MTTEPSLGLDVSVFNAVVESGSPDERRLLAVELVRLTNDPETLEGERASVVPVLLKLAVDPVGEVRRALAGGLLAARGLHPDLLFTIVADDDDIALPFLGATPSLDACRMLAILRVGDPARQVAVALRPDITAEAIDDVIAYRAAETCLALFDNPHCRFEERHYRALYRRFGHSHEIVERLIARDDLPLDIRILQAKRASNRMHQLMAEKGWIAANDATELVEDAEETAILRILLEASPQESHRVLAFLSGKQMLTPSLILRAACVGEMTIVERALAHLGNLPSNRVHKALYAEHPGALRTIHTRAGLPASCFAILKAAGDVAREADEEGLRIGPDNYGRRLIEALMTRYESLELSDRAKALEFVGRFAQDRVRLIAKRLKADLLRAA